MTPKQDKQLHGVFWGQIKHLPRPRLSITDKNTNLMRFDRRPNDRHGYMPMVFDLYLRTNMGKKYTKK